MKFRVPFRSDDLAVECDISKKENLVLPRSNVENWKRLQDQNYFENHPCYKGLVDKGDSECELIESFLPISKSLKVVVIGCGYGRESLHIAKRCNWVYGIDVSNVILGKAKTYLTANGVSNFTPVLTDKYPTEIPDGIDLVFSIVVMQHITRDLVEDYFRVLSPKLSRGGRFVVQFLEHLDSWGEKDAQLNDYEPSVSWTTAELAALCERSGLRLEQVRTILATKTALWHWLFAGPETNPSAR